MVKLVAEMDRYIPIPKREVEKPFLMPVEDVFSISGRGTVVTGRIERGIVKVNDEVEIVGLKATVKTICTGVEMFRKLLDEGQAGDNVGVLLRGTKREDVERGQVLAKPGSDKTLKSWFSLTRAMALYRTGDFTGCVEWADRCKELGGALAPSSQPSTSGCNALRPVS